MGEIQYVPGSTEAVGLAITATWEPGRGWLLDFHTARPSERGIVSTRMRYNGLSATELVDVIDIELAQALRLI